MQDRLTIPPWALLGILGAAALAMLAKTWVEGDRHALIVKCVFYGGALLGLALHEFAHGIVAYWGGDYTVRERGLLTLNPFRFMHPVFSVLLPMVMVAIGGLPLMGGATTHFPHLLRNRYWGSLVSFAGPLASFLFAIVLAIPFMLHLIDPDTALAHGLAALIYIELVLGAFNLVPLPPLDGWGVVEPFLPPNIADFGRRLGVMSIFLVYMMMRMVPALAIAVYLVPSFGIIGLQVPWEAMDEGLDAARFIIGG